MLPKIKLPKLVVPKLRLTVTKNYVPTKIFLKKFDFKSEKFSRFRGAVLGHITGSNGILCRLP